MNRLTQKIIEYLPSGVYSVQDITALETGGDNKRYALVKRAIASGDLVHIRRGLYSLAPVFQKKRLNPYCVAQHIYGPSYISLESALRWHNWIPEAVYSITSVSFKNSKDFDTPLGYFSYRRIPQNVFYAGVNHQTDATDATDRTGTMFLMATPLKALADYVYIHKRNWHGIKPVIESLRVEPEEFEHLTAEEFDVITENYNSQRVKHFCNGLRKDLQL